MSQSQTQTKRSSRILVITKLKTTNIGNQALSSELIRLTQATYPDATFAYVSRPSGLHSYSLRKLQQAKSTAQLFEQWVQEISTSFQSLAKVENESGAWSYVPPVVLTDVKKFSNPWELFKGSIRQYVVKFASPGTLNHLYKHRFALLNQADIVVYNGAGEVRDNDIAFRQLLELRIAQRLGCRVIPVNQSIAVDNPVLSHVLSMVYKDAAEIIVRGPVSKQNLVSLGVPKEKIRIAADMAFLVEPPHSTTMEQMSRKESLRPNTVGITIAKFHDLDMEGWKQIIYTLQKLGKQILFVSNDFYYDVEVAEQFQRQFDVRMINQAYNYTEYTALLSQLELVISSRLHTNILAMVAGTPTIPLTGDLLKMEDVFQTIASPVDVIDRSQPNWANRVVETIQYVYANYDMIKTETARRVVQLQESARENVSWQLPHKSLLVESLTQ